MAGKSNLILFGYVLLLVASSCTYQKQSASQNHNRINEEIKVFDFRSSIRALEVISEDEVWFAGSNGIYGFTVDGGKSWLVDSIELEGQSPDFRSIAVLDSSVFLLNAGAPVNLLKSVDQGKHWKIVYQQNHPAAFYNSMKFWDQQNGIAVGDPIANCLSVLITRDGGNTWSKLECNLLPETYEGEAGFAASNTNIALKGNHAWLATGGKKARIFHSSDKGNSWEVIDTPMQQGGKMTGIFSIDFYDETKGIVFGGNWEDQSNNRANKAKTRDGGTTWQLLNDGKEPGYRSCVQYIPDSDGQGLFAVGIPGISYSGDGGTSWQFIDQQYFYTIRLVKGKNTAWLAGKNKVAKMTW